MLTYLISKYSFIPDLFFIFICFLFLLTLYLHQEYSLNNISSQLYRIVKIFTYIMFFIYMLCSITINTFRPKYSFIVLIGYLIIAIVLVLRFRRRDVANKFISAMSVEDDIYNTSFMEFKRNYLLLKNGVNVNKFKDSSKIKEMKLYSDYISSTDSVLTLLESQNDLVADTKYCIFVCIESYSKLLKSTLDLFITEISNDKISERLVLLNDFTKLLSDTVENPNDCIVSDIKEYIKTTYKIRG